MKQRIQEIMQTELFKKALHFTVTSGIGWLMDMAIFTFLTVALNADPLWSNFFSAFCAVGYVFFVSVNKIFQRNHHIIWDKFAAYLCSQAVLITVFSSIIAWGAGLLIALNWPLFELEPVIAKIFATPFSLTLNFFIMRYIVEHWRKKPDQA